MDANNYALNRVFSRETLRHLMAGEREEAYEAVVRRYVTEAENKSNNEIISEIFRLLSKHYRNEYYYKNTLLNKLLLGIHSVNTTTVLSELPVAESKADFVMINGKAVVYEIKTELDNLERLPEQIADYYKAFDHVAVVTHESKASTLRRFQSMIKRPFGIYVLNKNNSITTLMKPEKYDRDLDPAVMFRLLRKKEYESILLELTGSLPNVSDFKYYRTCKDLFINLDISKTYSLILEKLKKRSLVKREELINVPYELRFLGYFMKLKENDYLRLDAFLKRQYGGT